MDLIALILAILAFIAVIGYGVFLWWQFSFTDSKLCKLIDERSKPVEYDLKDTEESYDKENDNNEYL